MTFHRPLSQSSTDHARLRLEALPLSRLHVAIIALCAIGFGIDLSETILGGVLSSVFTAPPHSLPSSQVGWLVASVYLGAVVGAPTLGRLADRIGQARALALTMVWLGVTSLLAVATRTPLELGLARFVSGVSLGAFPPLMIAFIANVAPTGRRGLMTLLICCLAFLLPPAAVFGVRAIGHATPLGLEGWRWPFLIAGLASLVVALGFRWAPEAPAWLLAKGWTGAFDLACTRFERSKHVLNPVQARLEEVHDQPLDTPGLGRIRLGFVTGLYFLNPWFTVAFPMLTGPILLARGYKLADALLYVGLATFGPSVATLATAGVADRFSRRSALVFCALAMCAAVGLFNWGSSAIALGAAVIAFGLFSNLIMPALTIFGAEQFPEQIRSSATSLAWSANRLAAAAAPMVLLPVLKAGGAAQVLAIIILALLLTIVLVVAYRPWMRRAPSAA